MRRVYGLLLIMGMMAVFLSGCATTREAGVGEGLVLADKGATDYVIVLADDASPSTKYAAEELGRFLKEMTGAEFPVRSDKTPMAKHEIILGDNAHLRELGVSVDFKSLGDEGYVIKTAGSRLVIAGGSLRGNLYGVYGLLDDHLGCRWFSTEVSRIPKRPHLTLSALDDRQIPVLEYREPFVMDCFDGDWCARNRMNSSSGRLEDKHGGKVRFGAGMFVHTFNGLVPPEKYFDTHPEYFSEVDGKRIKEHTQLCCTNEEVIQICIEEVKKRIQSDPGAFVYSVSQNDWGNYCQCAKCQALAKAEDTQMAPVLALVNRVAEAVEKDFPGKAIETLAYQWTRKPPKSMRPRPNVIIRLCSIECCFMHPLATCDGKANTEFRKDAEGWAKVANRLWVWDYVTSFAHYFVPFPNYRVWDDNIQFFIKNNVRGIFEQDTYTTLSGELSQLGGYVMAKQLWNQDYCREKAVAEFLDGVYGKGGRYIGRYMDLLSDKVEKDNIHAVIWVGPVEVKYLTDDIMKKADRLWDKAEAAVAAQPDVLERVRVARLSLDYAWIEKHRNSTQFVNHARYAVEPDPAFTQRVKRFFEVARRAKVTWMNEGRTTLDAYEEGLKGILQEGGRTLTPVEPVSAAGGTPGIAYAYYEGQWEKLPDFDSLKPVKEGVVDTISLSPKGRDHTFALRFRGLVEAPANGVYRFMVKSNDGSKLLIGDQVVVDNDGLHAMQEASGVVALKKGLHPITILYFDAGGEQGLAVAYDGPGIKKQAIPAKALFHP